MILGIDASSVRIGGGVTYLVELLRTVDPLAHGFSQVIIWGGEQTLARLEDRPWLVKFRNPLLGRSVPFRAFWLRYRLSRLARDAGCDVLFVPGGSYAGDFHPVVAFHQNQLPFEWHELRRFGWSWLMLKLALLRVVQSRTFLRADGVIFLTRYARDTVARVIEIQHSNTAIIPHGVGKRFVLPLRKQLPIGDYSPQQPFRILYVSSIYPYKHQWNVAEAVALLRARGLPVVLDLAGPAYNPAMKRLRRTLDRVDPDGSFVRYLGEVPYSELHHIYAQAHLNVFASSCETFGQTLTEAMSAALPIACSDRSAMPELLGEAGVYFDPESVPDIARALMELIDSPDLRSRLARAAFERVQVYSWARCASETFDFLAAVAGLAKPAGAASAK